MKKDEGEDGFRRLEKRFDVVVGLFGDEEGEGEEEEVVVVEIRRNVFGLGINCLDRTSSSILCASRSVKVTRRIQTTRRKIATMVIILVINFFRRSLMVELRLNRYECI